VLTEPAVAVPATKLCEIEDFSDPALAGLLRRVSGHPAGRPGRGPDQRPWLAAIAVLALQGSAALGPDARVLAVGAGLEPVLSELAEQVGEVTGVDWAGVDRLGRPDGTFDVVVCGPIEGVDDLAQLSAAMATLGRLLEPGGVLSLSTRFRLHGPPGGIGWPGKALVLDGDETRRHVVEPSGLTLVGEVPEQVSDATMSARRDLGAATYGDDSVTGPAAVAPPVAVAGGYVFTMAHLLLRKTDGYAATWAPAAIPEAAAVAPRPAGDGDGWAGRVVDLQEHLVRLDELLERGAYELDVLSEADWQVGRSLAIVDEDRAAAGARLADLPGDASREVPSATPAAGPSFLQRAPDVTACAVGLAEGLEFAVMVDAASADPITTTFMTGYCLFQDLVSLMLQLVSPGDAVLDVGAHLGTFTLAAAAAGCPVVAVEASPLNVELLRGSVSRNGFHQVRVVGAAASDQPGTLQFCAIGPWGTVLNRPANALSIEVPAITIDELLFELGMPKPRFVKMDIEGSEIRAMRGMAQVLSADDAPALLLESNGHTLGLMGTTPSELLAEVEGFGYTAYMVGRGRLIPVRATDLQPRTEVDYLALKRWPASLTGWDLAEPLTDEERVWMLVEDCRSESEDCRAYIGRALADAGPELMAHPALRAALDLLADDPVGTVRGAVAWWAPGELA
jgi:FkbM family methyltransferase